MELPSIGRIREIIKKQIIKIKHSKKLFSFLGIIFVVVLLTFSVFAAKTKLESLSGRDFSFLMTGSAADKLSNQNLFAKPAKNFIIESPEMIFVQKNSMVRVSPPAIANTQVLGGVLGGIESVELETSRDTIIEYLVEQGDTLSSVAKKFDISLNTILWANELNTKSVIKPGQKLIILPVSGVLHLVRKGDTLSSLSKTYQAKIEEIIAFNNLSDEGDIYIGDLLIIPNGKMPKRVSQVASIPLAESYFIFPTEGKITFGPHGVFNNAIDVANKCGKIVVAAAGGTVQRVGPIRIGGNRVTILHPNGAVTYYGHLSKTAVVPGQKVTAGQVIGYIGNTGYTLGSTGCHLHFEVRGAKNFLAKYPVGSYLSWEKQK